MDWLNNIFAGIYELGSIAYVTNFSGVLYAGKFYSQIGVYSIGLAALGVLIYYFIIANTPLFNYRKWNKPKHWIIAMLILGLLGYFLMTIELDAFLLSKGGTIINTQASTQLSVINAVFVMLLFYCLSFIRKVTRDYHQGVAAPH